jgi:hypothetical protein
MFKKIFIIFIFCSLLWPTVFCYAETTKSTISADDPINIVAPKSGYTTKDVTQYSLSETIGGIIKIFLGMVGVIFFALTFYAGYLWLTASGNEENIEKAKSIITASTIGLIIVLMAYGITTLVEKSVKQAVTPPITIK